MYKYKYLFGPVPSRRLGMSLGIDLVPSKVCTLNCIYCEVGKTTQLTTDRKEYSPVDKITEELKHYLDNNPDPDHITITGSGEPTLNSRFGDFVDFAKQIRPNIPLAVLTNGTLSGDPQVRKELQKVDIILPSLDAATRQAFLKMDRPESSIDLDEYIEGLAAFRKEFSGKIWLEVFITPGYNDGENDLIAFKKAFERIKPDSIQLNTLDRPGLVKNIRAATRQELQKIIDYWALDNVIIIAAPPKRKQIVAYRKDAEAAILDTLARRPCTLDDLTNILGISKIDVLKYLDILTFEQKVSSSEGERGAFYEIARIKNAAP